MCRRTLTRFQATFRGRDGVSYANLPRAQSKYNSLFEMMEAAHWRGIEWDAFVALDTDEQARLMAHYRTHHQIRAVEDWYNHKRAQRNAE